MVLMGITFEARAFFVILPMTIDTWRGAERLHYRMKMVANNLAIIGERPQDTNDYILKATNNFEI